MSKIETFKFVPDGRVLNDFFKDRSPVSIIQGPVGSGTSTTCCFKMWKIANEQQADRYGYRRTKWVVVRNTFDELKSTTIATWRNWFVMVAQGAYGDVKMSNPPQHFIEATLRDGSVLDFQVEFLSLDREEDIRKLLSREYTGAWFNEVQFSEKGIFDAAHSRAAQGRYPPKVSGAQPTWKGIIADLNAPPEGHWIPYMRGDVPLPLEWDDEQRREFAKPDGWSFFVQPPGLIEIFENGRLSGYLENTHENRVAQELDNPDFVAENKNWVEEPYLELIKGKSKSWIDTYVMNRVGLYRAGKPVFESFVQETHVSKVALELQPEWPLIVGLDFARNPAAVIGQFIRGQLYVLDEFGMENVAATTFAPALRMRLMAKFPEVFSENSSGIQFWGDPTGDSKGQGTDNTPYQIFQANGMSVAPAPGHNSISLRLNAVESLLNRMVDGSPALLLDPHLRTLKAGMAGAYHFAKLRGQARHHDEPYKDRYADFCDALQYLALGCGLGTNALMAGKGAPKPVRTRRKKYSLRR